MCSIRPEMIRTQTVPCLKDNLSYLVIDDTDRSCVIIDPSEARPFLDEIQAQSLELKAILATHHHYDHIGGLAELKSVPVWSSLRDKERIPGAGSIAGSDRRTFSDRETLTWSQLTGSKAPSDVFITALEIPGHTEGQMAYVFESTLGRQRGEAEVFVGDTLFSLGCGRCLEGTPEILFASLQKLKSLPPQSRIHFGHEYTEKNALFWLSLAAREQQSTSPESTCIDVAQIHLELTKVSQSKAPRPAPTLESEMKLNPFLRTKNASEFRRWRDLRNQF